MNEWHFFDQQTGALTDNPYRGPRDGLALNTPAGHAVFEGACDPRTQKVDIATGELIAREPPPAPDADHEWSADIGDWVMKPSAVMRGARQQQILAQIQALELSQLRPMREWMGSGGQKSRDRVLAIEQQITPLREELRGL